MLFIYNALGLFHALIIPLVIGRMKHPYIIIALSGILQIIGYVGLLYEPALSWAWAVVLAPSWMVGTALFQLINLRTHTTTVASALSSFVQGVGYIFAGIGPLFVGVLHEWTGGWTVPIWVPDRGCRRNDGRGRAVGETRISRRRRGGARQAPVALGCKDPKHRITIS
jgi:CP family cyanate transporter-like MFS transporter